MGVTADPFLSEAERRFLEALRVRGVRCSFGPTWI
jgi:hypothetical protein